MDADSLYKNGNNFEIKSEVNKAGEEKDVIKGFLATTVVDSTDDMFTKSALEDMAEQINQDNNKTVDTIFPGAQKVEESMIGNREHENNPAFPFADTRTVPSFKLTSASVKELPETIGKGYGLHVTGELNSDGLPSDTISAVKNSLRNGYLHSMSIEFKPQKVRDTIKNGRVVRVIEKALQKGAALTARPMNHTAKLTDAMVKSEYVEYIDETENDITGGKMPEENTQEVKNEEDQTDEEEVVNEPEQEEAQEVEEESVDEGKSESADEAEEEESVEDGDEETKSVRDEISEIKSKVSQVREENEDLREENQELKNQIEDLNEFKSIKESLDEIKSSLDHVSLEDGPRAEQEQERFSQETKADWKRTIDAMGVTAEHLEAKSKTGVRNVDAFVEGKDVSADEVLKYVK